MPGVQTIDFPPRCDADCYSPSCLGLLSPSVSEPDRLFVDVHIFRHPSACLLEPFSKVSLVLGDSPQHPMDQFSLGIFLSCPFCPRRPFVSICNHGDPAGTHIGKMAGTPSHSFSRPPFHELLPAGSRDHPGTLPLPLQPLQVPGTPPVRYTSPAAPGNKVRFSLFITASFYGFGILVNIFAMSVPAFVWDF